MNIEILEQSEQENGCILRVKGRMSAADCAVAVDEAFAMFADQMQLNQEKNLDFRATLIQSMGEARINSMVSNYVASKAAPSIINQLDLRTMFNPEPLLDTNVLGEGDFDFNIDFVIKPSYELSSYEPVTVIVPKYETTPDMVDNQIAQMMDPYATFELASGSKLAMGDWCRAKTKVSRQGETVGGLSGDNQLIQVNYGMMPDGFIDNICGMKVGETKEFDFEGLKDNAKTVEDKEMFHCVITIIDKRRRVLPALTDNFIQKNFGDRAQTVSEFEAKLAEEIQTEIDKQAQQERESLLDEELAKRLVAEIPDLYYERSREEILDNLQRQLSYQNMSLEHYIESQGMDEDGFNMVMMLQSMNTLRQGFALDAIFRHLSEPITDQDIEAALSQIAPQHEKQARREFDESNTWFIVEKMAERMKAHNWVVETATYETRNKDF